MSTFKRFAPAGGFAFVAIVAIIALNFGSGAPQASAQQIAENSYKAVSGLTPAQREELKKTIHIQDNPAELLQKAQSAKDLKTLTYEEFMSQQPKGAMPPPGSPKAGAGGSGIKPVDMRNLKFLQFTHENGSKVTLGIDPSTGLPVIVMSMFENPDTKSMPGSEGKEVSGTSVGGEGGTIFVGTERYAAPGESADGPSSVEVRDGGVYINGVKSDPK